VLGCAAGSSYAVNCSRVWLEGLLVCSRVRVYIRCLCDAACMPVGLSVLFRPVCVDEHVHVIVSDCGYVLCSYVRQSACVTVVLHGVH
jgi:hypothetical protein